MALPMDEQRILDEMERVLAADDPKLAARLASFGRPGIGTALRAPRARAMLSLASLAVIAAIALVLYAVSAFRPGAAAYSHHRPVPVSSSQRSVRPASISQAPVVGHRSPGIRP